MKADAADQAFAEQLDLVAAKMAGLVRDSELGALDCSVTAAGLMFLAARMAHLHGWRPGAFARMATIVWSIARTMAENEREECV